MAPQPIRRVALITAMRSEMRPLVRTLSLQRSHRGDLPVYEGRIGDVDVVGAVTGMGVTAAAEVTERLLAAAPVDHVVVSGISGGVGTAKLHDLIVPELVVHGSTKVRYQHTPLGGAAARGTLWTTDPIMFDVDTLTQLGRDGVIAVDMETAAIAEVSERRGVPWSVFRVISDMAINGPVDDAVFNLAHPDGSPNVPASIRFLLTHPWRIPRLVRLGRDAKASADAAAAAAIAAISTVSSPS
jgi:nucleoside phosphorylase